MTPLELAKQNIDLASIIESAGVTLNRNGFGLCPFHDEKTPSFKVFPDNRFKCFGGCGEHGDVIDFVQKFYGLSFQDALKHLGIEQGELTPKMKAEIERRKIERQKQESKKKFRTDLQNTLLTLISATNKAARNFKTIDDLEKYGDILQPLPWWEYCLDVLAFGTKDDQDRVCEQFKDIELLPVKGFFKPEFDYFAWLRKFNEKRDTDEWTINLHFAGRETSCEETPASG